jgi:hypothetical protein
MQAHAVVDDILYNIIHDIVLQAHREEKIARATSAAIVVEQKAAQTDPNNHDDSTVSAGNNIQPHVVETDAATFNSGEVYLKGNPLKSVSEIRCSKCGLPRLLHPTDGNGARKPEPGVEYCKRRPFIDKPHHDVYGQTFVPEGPGRGKKKKDMVDPLKQQKDATPNGSQDSPGTSPPPGEGPAKPIPFPHAKCINCNTFLPIKRMNNHMNKCIGGNGRESSRNALNKIQNGNGNGGQNGFTPPGSRNSTPAPSSKNRNSPSKRSADDAFGSDDSPEKKQKKPLKKTPANKLKAPKMVKSASQHSASGLSFEQKPPQSDEEEDDGGDDDRDGDFNGKDTISVETKKKNKLKQSKPSIVKKPIKTKSKWLYNNKGGLGNTIPPALPPDGKGKAKNELNGKGGIKRGESESSQTLSSPNVD